MAARFWLGTTSTNWNLTANWSATSGGASGASVPIFSDDITFDGAGNNPAATAGGARAGLSLTVASGYTKNIALDQNLSISGNITLHTGFTFSGAASLIMLAAGTITSNGKAIETTFQIGNFTSGTVTLGDNLTCSGDLQMTNVTSTTFSGAFNIAAATCTVSGSQTVTLSGNVSITGLTTSNGPNVMDGAFNWNTGGMTMSNGTLSGAATLVFNGTGTWSGGVNCSMSVTINTAGTLTISGTILYLTGTITYTAGTVTVSGSTLSIQGACTFATSGMSWNNILIVPTGGITITLNSLLSATGILTLPNGAVMFAGTAGFTVGTLTNTSINANRIITFHAAATYTVTSSFSTVNPSTARFSYVSSSPGTYAIFILQSGASQDVSFTDPTDIDSSAGVTIFTFRGTVTTTLNWTATVPTGGVGGGVRVFAYAG